MSTEHPTLKEHQATLRAVRKGRPITDASQARVAYLYAEGIERENHLWIRPSTDVITVVIGLGITLYRLSEGDGWAALLGLAAAAIAIVVFHLGPRREVARARVTKASALALLDGVPPDKRATWFGTGAPRHQSDP